MTNTIASYKVGTRFLATAGVALALSILPAIGHAATFAYVNASGDVATVVANDPMTAIAIAPNIALHSGVLLLDSPADNEVVGDEVPGV